MKSLTRSVFAVFSIVVLFSTVACKNKSKFDEVTPYEPRVDFGMERTHEDTVQVVEIAKSYLDKLKSNDISSALAMLHEVDSTGVHAISAQRAAAMSRTYEQFPVVEYTIDEVWMYSEVDTEVRFSYEFFKKSDDDKAPNVIKGSVHPKRVDGKWYLTVENVKYED